MSPTLRKPSARVTSAAISVGETQRCTVHKDRNVLAHACQRLHEEVSADYTDMIYAASAAEVEQRRRASPPQMAARLSKGAPQCRQSCAFYRLGAVN
jgi:transposase-like protein